MAISGANATVILRHLTLSSRLCNSISFCKPSRNRGERMCWLSTAKKWLFACFRIGMPGVTFSGSVRMVQLELPFRVAALEKPRWILHVATLPGSSNNCKSATLKKMKSRAGGMVPKFSFAGSGLLWQSAMALLYLRIRWSRSRKPPMTCARSSSNIYGVWPGLN